jgi:hypothetical protein
MCCMLYVIWYTVVCYLLSANCLAYCLLSVVAENSLEFGDKLWPSDDEVAPNDGVCGSGIWTCISMSVVTLSMFCWLLAVGLFVCCLAAYLFVALLTCCLTGLLPCSISSVVVAWSLCTLWLLGSQAVIFNDARD